MERALFRNMMYDLFNRLQSKRTRVIKDRQIELLKMLLEVEKIDCYQFLDRAKVHYKHVANFSKTLGRDIGSLVQLGASEINKVGDKNGTSVSGRSGLKKSRSPTFLEKSKRCPRARLIRSCHKGYGNEQLLQNGI
jgi:hypothetical protein